MLRISGEPGESYLIGQPVDDEVFDLESELLIHSPNPPPLE